MAISAKDILPEPSFPIVDDSPTPPVPPEVHVQEIVHEVAPILSSPIPTGTPVEDAMVSGLENPFWRLLRLRCA